MDTTPLYIATERFEPSDSKHWRSYAEWAKIPALAEVVGLDSSLCRHLVRELMDEDWDHIVKEDFRLDYFLHLDYLLTRVAHIPRRNILGLYRNPDQHITEPPGSQDFVFPGSANSLRRRTQISALTNCGGFPKAFLNEELNQRGLISGFQPMRRDVQRLLRGICRGSTRKLRIIRNLEASVRSNKPAAGGRPQLLRSWDFFW